MAADRLFQRRDSRDRNRRRRWLRRRRRDGLWRGGLGRYELRRFCRDHLRFQGLRRRGRRDGRRRNRLRRTHLTDLPRGERFCRVSCRRGQNRDGSWCLRCRQWSRALLGRWRRARAERDITRDWRRDDAWRATGKNDDQCQRVKQTMHCVLPCHGNVMVRSSRVERPRGQRVQRRVALRSAMAKISPRPPRGRAQIGGSHKK
jgi:hypothetical protein